MTPRYSLQILLIVCALFSCNAAQADVYVSADNTDEIVITNAMPVDGDFTRLAEPTAPAPTQSVEQNPSNAQLPYHAEVMAAAAQTQLAPALIHAVIAVESKHNANARSNKGALGLMQLMPTTAMRFNVKNQLDPQQNILAGAKYLRELTNLYGGDLKLTLAAYNAGPAAVKKYNGQIPPYAETLAYVPKVLKFYTKFSSLKSI